MFQCFQSVYWFWESPLMTIFTEFYAKNTTIINVIGALIGLIIGGLIALLFYPTPRFSWMFAKINLLEDIRRSTLMGSWVMACSKCEYVSVRVVEISRSDYGISLSHVAFPLGWQNKTQCWYTFKFLLMIKIRWSP